MPDVGVTGEWIRDQFIKLTALCERIMTKQEDQDRRIEKIERKVDEICEKPSKRWEVIVTAFITTVVGIIIGAYFAIPKL